LKCKCCGKTNCKQVSNSTGEKSNSGNVVTSNKKKGGVDDTKLSKDDKTMLRIKAEDPNCAWQKVLDATNSWTNKDVAKERFDEIKHRLDDFKRGKVGGGDDNKKEDNYKNNNANEGKKRNKNKNNDQNQNENQNQGKDQNKPSDEEIAKKRAEKQAKNNGSVAEDNKEDKKSDSKVSSLFPFNRAGADHLQSDMKSTSSRKDSTNTLKAWAAEYDKNKGQMLASKHFDQTGIRITAREAMKLAAED
jgi:hypothetical protein